MEARSERRRWTEADLRGARVSEGCHRYFTANQR